MIRCIEQLSDFQIAAIIIVAVIITALIVRNVFIVDRVKKPKRVKELNKLSFIDWYLENEHEAIMKLPHSRPGKSYDIEVELEKQYQQYLLD